MTWMSGQPVARGRRQPSGWRERARLHMGDIRQGDVRLEDLLGDEHSKTSVELSSAAAGAGRRAAGVEEVGPEPDEGSR